ncbi:hypothetical protein QBC36DRAFT_321171 [Triangularia setosa]|uniref:Uncharacterized protein n=1 Tax=Triangularia setosa TaxID=2587417 RepID=A0AAN6WDU1_9PEZI|nr:hypothetical protein QBC36DRAFT_321171 [Podospora setosa]
MLLLLRPERQLPKQKRPTTGRMPSGASTKLRHLACCSLFYTLGRVFIFRSLFCCISGMKRLSLFLLLCMAIILYGQGSGNCI